MEATVAFGEGWGMEGTHDVVMGWEVWLGASRGESRVTRSRGRLLLGILSSIFIEYFYRGMLWWERERGREMDRQRERQKKRSIFIQNTMEEIIRSFAARVT